MKYRSKMILLSYLGSMSILVFVGFIFGYYFNQAVKNEIDLNPNSMYLSNGLYYNTSAITTRTLSSPSDIENKYKSIESNYETTMRSCLGTYCFDDPVQDKNNNNIIRIGILMPDMIHYKDLLKSILTIAGLVESSTLEIIYSSNVPPYGYGKNHGWSKIIRISNPIFSNAMKLLFTNDTTSLPSSKKISTLLEPQLRQLMRWHCRLSHVAAHTAMLTDDFINRPIPILDQILSFIGIKPSRDNLLKAIANNDYHSIILKWNEDLVSIYEINKINLSNVNELYDIAASTINQEMLITKQLTKWPCKSFSDDKYIDLLPIPISSLISNCKANYVKCSINYDIHAYERLNKNIHL